jgi:hypothetical protein
MFVIGQDKQLFKRELYFHAQFHNLLITTRFLVEVGLRPQTQSEFSECHVASFLTPSE